MLRRIIISSFFLVGGFFSFLQEAYAYDDKTTHPALTQEIVDFYNRNSGTQITPEQKEWIIKGSILEDTPPRWVNHFYDPIYGTGWTGENAGNLSSSLTRKLAAIIASFENPVSAIEWADNGLIQEENRAYGGNRTWKKALEYYANGNTEQAYLTLGHILHLLEDMAVPDHTRDDTHVQGADMFGESGSPYEAYASRWNRQNIGALNLYKDLNFTSPSLSSVYKDYLARMAEYSNKYFFSKDTINNPKYDQPKIVREKENLVYGLDEGGDEIKLAMQRNVWDDKSNSYIPKKELNSDSDKIFDNYFTHLSKQAILNGAAVISIFQKQAEDAVINKEFPTHLVRYDVSKITPPNISFLGIGSKLSGFFSSSADKSTDFLASIYSGFKNLTGKGTDYLFSLFRSEDNGQTFEILPKTEKPEEEKSEIKTIPQEERRTHKVTRVVDGDTIILEGGQKIRYTGVDAPEISSGNQDGDCFSLEAKEKNEELVLGKSVILEKGIQDKDEYGRFVRYVWVGSSLVNAKLLEEGYAKANTFGWKHPREKEFKSLQDSAKINKKGMWGPVCEKTKEEQKALDKPASAYVAPLLINEIKIRDGEFLEIYNPTDSSVNLSGYFFSYYPAAKTSWSEPWRVKEFPASSTISAGGMYVVGFGDAAYDWGAYDSNLLAENGTIAIWAGSPGESRAVLIDALGWGNVNLFEGQPAISATSTGILARKNALDSQNNKTDFSETSKATPGRQNVFVEKSGSEDEPTRSLTGPIPKLRITEIMYDPQGSDAGREWIEIFNGDSLPVDISRLKIREGGTNHSVKISGTQTISPGSYLVIVSKESSFRADFPNFAGALALSSLSLNNSGELIYLKYDDGVITQIEYSPQWGARGDGNSIQSIDGRWKSGAPTPGEENRISENAQNSTSTESSTIPGALAGRIVISELQVSGADAGDEFIEIYNPLDSTVDLSGWSIQYIGGSSQFSADAVSKKNFPAGARILGKSFYLIARGLNAEGTDGYRGAIVADMAHRSFGMSGNSSGGKVFLVMATDPINSEDDPSIIDKIDYSLFVPGDGKSAERRAWTSGGCVIADKDGEFIGNGCIANDISKLFESRQAPNPQNSSSFPEPRVPPAIPSASGSFAAYIPGSVSIEFNWNPSADFSGTTSSVSYELRETGGSGYLKKTSSTDFTETINEVGRTYSYTLKAVDRDGLDSSSTVFSVDIPSFLASLKFYAHPRNSSGTANYIIDASYQAHPFIPEIWSSPANRDTWQGMAFYLNRKANAGNYVLGTAGNFEPENLSGVVKLSETSPQYAAVFGLTPERSNGVGGGLNNSSFFLPEEDMHLVLNAIPTQRGFSEGDYITVGFYDFALSGGGNQELHLVATDAVQYRFQTSTPPQSSPASPALNLSFDGFNSVLGISWSSSTDPDSPDAAIRYELNISTSSILDDGIWQNMGNLLQTSTIVTSGNSYLIGVRAKDDMSNISGISSRTWNFPPGYTPFIKSGYATVGAQEFSVSTSGNMTALKLYIPDFEFDGGAYPVCKVALHRINSTSTELVANSATPSPGDGISGPYEHRGPDCSGLPVSFTFDPAVEIAGGEHYRWTYYIDTPYPNMRVKFLGIAEDKAGGAFNRPEITNAVFDLKAGEEYIYRSGP